MFGKQIPGPFFIYFIDVLWQMTKKKIEEKRFDMRAKGSVVCLGTILKGLLYIFWLLKVEVPSSFSWLRLPEYCRVLYYTKKIGEIWTTQRDLIFLALWYPKNVLLDGYKLELNILWSFHIVIACNWLFSSTLWA